MSKSKPAKTARRKAAVSPDAPRCELGGREQATQFGRKPQPRRTQPPRIVIVDDDGSRQVCKLLLKKWLKKATVLEFGNSDDAWKELSRTDPDLLVTRLPVAGEELLPLLGARKVKYPILIASGFFTEKEVRQRVDPNLNVSVLPLPFTVKQFCRELLIHLGPSDNLEWQILNGSPEIRSPSGMPNPARQ